LSNNYRCVKADIDFTLSYHCHITGWHILKILYHKYVKYIEGNYPDILSLGIRWMLTTSVTHCMQFTDGEGVWVGPSAVWDKAENILPMPENEPRFLARPVRSVIIY
jgi:hypothetical protein